MSIPSDIHEAQTPARRSLGSGISRTASAILLVSIASIAATLLAVFASSASTTVAGPLQPDPPTDPPPLFDETTVRDYRFTFDDPDWESSLQRIASTEYVFATLEVDGETYEDVGLRIKGNSSARGSGRKVPLNVTMDAVVSGQDLMGYDTLNLNSGFMNPTFTREILTLSQLRIAQPMPKAAYVRVFADGEYFGLYTLVQQIEGTFDREWFSGGGMRIKGDAPEGGGGGPGGPGGFRSNLTWLGEDLASYRSAYELKSAPDEDEAFIALRELTRVLDAPESAGGPSDADFPAAIQAVLDVDNALWYLASINLFTNYDSYYAGHNFFLYRPNDEARFHILSWDINESFGLFPGAGINPSDSEAVATTDPFLMTTGGTSADRPLIGRLLAVPSFRADYIAHYRTLLAESFDPGALESAITTYQTLISDDVREDPNKIYTFEDFTRGVWEDLRIGGGGGGPGGGERSAPGIMKVATRRAEWLSARADFKAPDLSLTVDGRDPAHPADGDAPRINLSYSGADTVTSAELVYTVNGGPPTWLPMAIRDGGRSAVIPAAERGDEITYYTRAQLADGRSLFHPSLNQTRPSSYVVEGRELPVEPTGDLVINEFMAINDTTIADPDGEFDDWVELYNRGTEPIDLARYFLSDAADDPFAFALPEVTLAPGDHYLIWCDNDPEQGPDHAPFALSGRGESVVLSTESVTVDLIEFGEQLADVSLARDPDGAESWVVCASPSPNAANVCSEVIPSPELPTTEPTAEATAAPTAPPETPAADGWSIMLPYAEMAR